MEQDAYFMEKAIALSAQAMAHGNEPFGAVLVKDGEIVYSSENQIHTATDPTFHAEAGLIRQFCQETGIVDLQEYTLYSSCEPCFMCSGAIVWSYESPFKIYKKILNGDLHETGFRDSFPF